MKVVYANADCVVAHGLERVRLSKGQTWDADDPFVKARPDMFTDTPAVIHRSAGVEVVESATRRPGERRTTRRG